MPGWPDPAASTASIASARMTLTVSAATSPSAAGPTDPLLSRASLAVALAWASRCELVKSEVVSRQRGVCRSEATTSRDDL